MIYKHIFSFRNILKSEKASSTLETAISFVIYLVVILAFFFLLLIRYLQVAKLEASLNLTKDIGFSLALKNGYQTQTFSNQEMSNFSTGIDKSKLDLSKIDPTIKKFLSHNLVNILTKDILGSSLKKYIDQNNIARKFRRKIKFNFNIKLPKNKERYGFINVESQYDFILFNYVMKLKMPYFTWQGFDSPYALTWHDTINKSKKNIINSPWDMHNFKRGRYFLEKEGANLPISYPSINKFTNNVATMIKSIDLTAPSYKEGQGFVSLEETIRRHARVLKNFKGNKKEFGKSRILIKEGDIRGRKLLVIVPENSPEYLLNKLEFILRREGILYEIKKDGVSQRYIMEKNTSP